MIKEKSGRSAQQTGSSDAQRKGSSGRSAGRLRYDCRCGAGGFGERGFEHDFDRVDYDVSEFDERAGTPGLHTVRGTVKAEPRATLLPPDLFNRFVNDAFWRDPKKIPEGLKVV